jgi:glycogen debranching enzyme
LLINGMQPLLLGSSVRDDNLTLTADLTNPDVCYDGHIALQRDALHIVRTAYLWNSAAHQRMAICNHSEETISFTLAFTFGADFADLFELRSHKRERRGHLQEIVSSETDVAFVYTGLDGTERKTDICFQPLPTQPLTSTATHQIGDIAEVWRRASVVSSWLLDLGAAALAKDPQLSGFPGFAQDSGEGR